MPSDTTPQEIELKFALRQMRILKASLDAVAIGQCTGLNHIFNIRLEAGLNHKESIAAVTTHITVSDGDKEQQLGEISIRTIFSIENWAEVMMQDGDVWNAPETVSQIFNGISLSTARGVVYTLFLNAKLQDVLLPVIDPRTLIPEPM